MPDTDILTINGTDYKIHDSDGRALVAPEELTSTATKAHDIGEPFVYDGKLYRATSDIAIGGAIVTTGTGANAALVPGGISGQVADLKSALERSDDTTIDDYNARSAVFDDVTSSATKTTGQFVQSNGNVGSSGLWNYYSLPVTSGEVYKVSAYQSDSIKSCMFLNSSNAVLAYYPSERDTSLTRYTFTVIVPSDAVTLIVNERTGSGYIASVIERFANYTYQHTESYNAWKTAQSAILSDETTIAVSPSDIAEKAGYYIASNGAEETSGLWRIMTVSVSSGEKYRVTSQFYGSIKGVFFYDSNDAFISPYYGNESSDTLHTLDVTVPTNAVTMRINDKKSSSFALYKYIKPINNDLIIVNGKTIENIINSFGSSGNVLFGKTLVTVGDSITYGADMDSAGIDPVTGELMTYGWQIANRNSMAFYNRGVSGSTVAAGTNRNGFAEPNGRYTQLPDAIDYLTIWFGWNDYACISDNLETLGDINSTDTNSYYGAYNTVLPYLINKYPNARIGLIVPFGANAGIRQAVRNLAQKWGIGYFDNYTGNTPLYYGKEDESVLASGLIAERRAIWQANGAHPSYAGHCQLATQIEAWLRSL